MNEKLATITMVLRQRQYAAMAIVTSIGLGILYYFFTMSMLQTHFQTVASISPAYIGASLTMTAIISVLAGINVSLIVFKIKRPKLIGFKKSGGSAAFGSAFAAFTPGCPACTTPLAVILGTVGGLAVFPMQGLELKLISIGALLFSIFWITRGLQRPSCCSTSKKH